MDDMKKLAIDTAINCDPNARIYTQALHTITEQAARIAELEAQLATARGDALREGVDPGHIFEMEPEKKAKLPWMKEPKT